MKYGSIIYWRAVATVVDHSYEMPLYAEHLRCWSRFSWELAKRNPKTEKRDSPLPLEKTRMQQR